MPPVSQVHDAALFILSSLLGLSSLSYPMSTVTTVGTAGGRGRDFPVCKPAWS